MTGCAHCQAVAISADTFRTQPHMYVSTPLKYLLSGVIRNKMASIISIRQHCFVTVACNENVREIVYRLGIVLRMCLATVDCTVENTPGYSLYIAQTFLHGINCICNPAGYISHYGTRTYQYYKYSVV